MYYNLNSSSTDYFLTHHTLNTVKLLRRCKPSMLETHARASSDTRRRQLPVPAYIDCNVRLFGFDDAHLAIRLLACIEVGLHPESYSPDSPTGLEILRDPLIVSPNIVDVFCELTSVGADGNLCDSHLSGFVRLGREMRLFHSARFVGSDESI